MPKRRRISSWTGRPGSAAAGSGLNRIRRWFHRHIAEFFDYPAGSPEVEFAFAHFRRDLAIRMIQLIAVALSAVVIVLWPADFYVFANDPNGMRILFVFRVGVVAAAIAVWLALRYVQVAREYPVGVFVVAVAAKLAADGWAVSRYAGPASPLFYPIYVIPFVTVLLPMPLRERVLATTSLVGSWLTAFYLTTPEHWLGPPSWTPILFLTGVSASAIALGHVIYVMVRGNFLQRVELLRRAGVESAQTNQPQRFVALSSALRERDAADAERARIELLDRLTSGLNHVLNNQLQVMLSASQYLLDNETIANDEEAVMALGDMVAAVESARDVTRQLRELGSPPAPGREPIELVSFLRHTASVLMRSLGGRPRIETTGTSHALWIEASRSQLRDLLVHLLTASVTLAESDEKPVRIACWSADQEECAVVRFHNPGERIEPDEVTAVFEPFCKRRSTGRQAGMLLASARQLSRRLSGHLTARRRSDGTLEYELRLPLTKASPPSAEYEDAGALQTDSNVPLHVVYCEDEAPLRHLIARAFERAGHRITSFSSGTEALAWMRDHLDEVDVLLTDVVMPGLRGFELAHLVRQLRQDLPVVFLTAQPGMTATEREWNRDSAAAVVFKPVPAADVVAVVESTVAAVGSSA